MADKQAPWGEYAKWLAGEESGSYYKDLLDEATTLPQRNAARKKILKAHELPWENSPHGLLKHIVNESMNARCETVDAYMQIIPPGSRSGKYKFQGEQVIYILEGKGHTLIDGVKHPWAAGDVLNLPVRKQGIIVQHVNEDPNLPAKFVAAEPNFFACTTVDRGSGFEQIEDAPEYRR